MLKYICHTINEQATNPIRSFVLSPLSHTNKKLTGIIRKKRKFLKMTTKNYNCTKTKQNLFAATFLIILNSQNYILNPVIVKNDFLFIPRKIISQNF